MASSERRFQTYDIFKLIVAIILILLILWLWRAPPGLYGAASPSPTPGGGSTAIAAATDVPALAVPTVEAVVGTDGVALSGTGTPNSTVQIIVNDQVAGQASVDANGRWSFSLSAPPGEHVVVVQALDAAGGAAAAAPPLTLAVPAPIDPPTLDALPATATTGALALSGTGTPGATVQIVIDGQVAGEATVGADGRWSFAAEIAAAGEHALQVNTLDSAGQVAASAPPATLQLTAAPTPTPTPRAPAVTVSPSTSALCNPNDPTAYGDDLGQIWRVDRCDTLSYISRQTGVDLSLLIAANPQVQDPDLIFPGQIVTLPGR